MKYLFLLGRAIYGGYFAYNGINHLLNSEGMSGYAGSKGVPQPKAAVIGTGAMMLAGGWSVVLGMRPRIGLSLILAFLAGVSPQMHDFWAIEDPNQRMTDMVNFAKNMALVGSALMLMAIPEPWPLSLTGAQPETAGGSVRRVAA